MVYQSAFSGNHFKDATNVQLTVADTQTANIGSIGLRNHTMQVLVASIGTDVVVELEGSHDGTNFFDIPLDSETPVTGLAVTLNRATITANGTYALIAKNTVLKFIRLHLVSINTGSPTVDSVYHGVN